MTTTAILEDGRVVEIRKLTVKNVDSWLDAMAAETATPSRHAIVDSLLFDDLDLKTVGLMVTLSEEELRNLTPDDIDTIVAGCKEANKHFFRMRERMLKHGREALEAQSKQ